MSRQKISRRTMFAEWLSELGSQTAEGLRGNPATQIQGLTTAEAPDKDAEKISTEVGTRLRGVDLLSYDSTIPKRR